MLPRNIEFIDLSQTIENGIPLASVLPRFSMWQCLSKKVGDSVNCQAELMTDHTGTHCDAPRHVFNEGKSIDEYPPEAYSGIAICLDLEKYDGKAITVEAIKDAELMAVRPIQKDDIVIMCTGHSNKWNPIPEGYEYLKNRPWVDPLAAQYLIDKKIKAIAIDVGGPDPLGGTRHIIHEMLLEKDIMIIESLHNLHKIKNKEVFLCAFPLKIGGGTGAPTRAVAMIDKDEEENYCL